jgi:hypothetical protein
VLYAFKKTIRTDPKNFFEKTKKGIIFSAAKNGIYCEMLIRNARAKNT